MGYSLTAKHVVTRPWRIANSQKPIASSVFWREMGPRASLWRSVSRVVYSTDAAGLAEGSGWVLITRRQSFSLSQSRRLSRIS
jgi:hypothetical protein